VSEILSRATGAINRMLNKYLPILILILTSMSAEICFSSENAVKKEYSGWRGGIGIAFGAPSRKIPDITELGYEIAWGDEDVARAKILNIAIFRYTNSRVEISLKDPRGKYDFSQVADKDEAAKLAFDAWAENLYGIKGLSKYAKVKYYPEGAYGDVYGTIDFSSENPLVNAIIDTYLKWFIDNGIKRGGIALDNAFDVTPVYLNLIKRKFNSRGLGIASNGCPDKYLSYIDVFGNEGFPFNIKYARDIRSRGFQGIFAEFTLQHLSPGELESYLKTKLFNKIVFFGYTDGGIAAGAGYSFYHCRPDVYNHHRWVLRKYIPLSRAVWKAGLQTEPYARIKRSSKLEVEANISSFKASFEVGETEEKRRANINEITGISPDLTPMIFRYGNNIRDGIYLYVDPISKADIVCDAKKLNIDKNIIVFDEFNERILKSKITNNQLEFSIDNGPALVQLGSKYTIVKNILSRIEEMFNQQLVQREMERNVGIGYPLKPWAPFCQGYIVDDKVARSGKFSLKTTGGTYTNFTPKWRYFNRQGAAQLVDLNQEVPTPITLRVYSKSEDVPRSELVSITDRRQHFSCREAYIYCVHLYIDYQEGEWPEIYTASFSPGTHGWEERTIKVIPKKPVKTAMVLLEFQQPQGSAWFDDVFLSQSTEPGKNLLAYPGFEKGDFPPAELNSLSKEYEGKINSLIELLRRIRGKTITRPGLINLEKEIDRVENWLIERKMERLWSREMRDLRDAKEKIKNCLSLLGGIK
jgi:hypothetical protein